MNNSKSLICFFKALLNFSHILIDADKSTAGFYSRLATAWCSIISNTYNLMRSFDVTVDFRDSVSLDLLSEQRDGAVMSGFTVALFPHSPGGFAGPLADLEHTTHSHLLRVSRRQQRGCR